MAKTTPKDHTAASRKAKSRLNAQRQFGLRPYTVYWSEEEYLYHRSSHRRKYKRDWTLSARRQHHVVNVDQAAAMSLADEQQTLPFEVPNSEVGAAAQQSFGQDSDPMPAAPFPVS